MLTIFQSGRRVLDGGIGGPGIPVIRDRAQSVSVVGNGDRLWLARLPIETSGSGRSVRVGDRTRTGTC